MTDITFLDDVYVDYIDHMGTDDDVLDAARVSTRSAVTRRAFSAVDRDNRINDRAKSYPIGTPWGEIFADADAVRGEEEGKDKALINFLMRDRHGSPFEHNVLKVKVRAPIFVFREWHRHRIASYNEMSGRYTKLDPIFYVPADDRPMKQVGKPGAYTFEAGEPHVVTLAQAEARKIATAAWRSYQTQLDAGVAKEIAREVLPVNVYSQMYCTMNLRALMNFLSLRTKPTPDSKVPSFPQHEISLGADKLEAIFAEKFPWTYEAWVKNGRVAP